MICLNVNTMTSNMMNDGAVCTIVKKEEGDDERCRFMEAVIDHKQFPETDIALQADTMLLNIFEYIKAVNYQIDQFMVNRFWQSMSAKNSYITCDIAVFEWLGYDNEGGARKQTFLKLLKANAITHKQIKHTDDDFDQYSEAVEEAKTLSQRPSRARSGSSSTPTTSNESSSTSRPNEPRRFTITTFHWSSCLPCTPNTHDTSS